MRLVGADDSQTPDDAKADAKSEAMPRVWFESGEDIDGSPDGSVRLRIKYREWRTVVHGLTLQDVRETWADTGRLLRWADDNSDPEG